MRSNPSDDWGGLNEDVWTEILTHLPVKSVIKFKLVCKQRLFLISTRYFCRLHTLRRHKSPPSLIVSTFSPRYYKLDDYFNYVNPITAEPATMIPFTINLPNNPQFKILSSSNGLLLLCNEYDVYNSLYVYNPTTKQSRKLSLPDHNNKLIHHIVQLYLVFNPSISAHYKIVCIRVEKRSTDTRMYQTQVFNSESGTWNVPCYGEPFTNPNKLDDVMCTIVNYGGAVHCNNMIYGKALTTLYCFDIDRNALLFLPLPNHERIPRNGSNLLQVSNDCLYYVLLVPGEVGILWELRGNDEWMVKYHDEHPHIPVWRPSWLLGFIIETSTILIQVRENIMAYNFLDQICKKLVGSLRCYPPLIVHQFAETLAPV